MDLNSDSSYKKQTNNETKIQALWASTMILVLPFLTWQKMFEISFLLRYIRNISFRIE
jgi:hypothetical protein